MQTVMSSRKISGLLVGALASLFLGRIFQLPFLLFLFPVFAIRYLRQRKLLPGFLLLFVSSAAVMIISFWGIAQHMFSSTAAFIAVMSVSTFVGLLPILLDAWLFKKAVNQSWLIIIYPSAKVFVEYIGSANSPFGIWGSQVSLLAGWQPFNNAVAYGGIWTLSLLVALFSSILVYILENGLRNNPFSKSLVRWYGLAVALVAFAGLVRIKSYEPDQNVKVAMVLADDRLRSEPVNKIYQHFLTRKQRALTSAEQTYYHHSFESSNLDLLKETNKAAAAGAKIIFCAEGNAAVLKSDEKALIDTVKKIAQKWEAYIGIAAEVYNPTAVKPVENKVIFIQPDGNIAFEYLKHFPIGIEEQLMVTGDGVVPTCQTPYGKVAAVICFDTDFIKYARKAGAAKVDILFAPSNDWNSIAELRGKITRYRALENGFTLVRPTSHGVTEALTPTGQVIFANNYFQHPLRCILTDIPSKHLPTLYVQFGDWLPILMLLVLAGVLISFWKAARKRNKVIAGTVVFFLLFLALPGFTQTYQPDSTTLTEKQPVPVKKAKTVLFPAISYGPETNLSLGLSAMRFYKTSANAMLSQVNTNILYTLNHQFVNEANLLHYTPGSNYLLKAELAFNKYPEKFYGIGNKTADDAAETITFTVLKADAFALKKIISNTYAGLHYNYANYYHVKTNNASSHILDTINGGNGSVKSGLGAALLYDSRDNINNSTQGWLGSITVTWNNRTIGSTTDYFAFDADIRKYHSLRPGSVLAFQGVMNIKQGKVPFTQLSYLGGGNIMRGFYAGRYRDNDLVAVQAEYRKHIWRNWGIVLFAGAGKVGESTSDINMKDLQHSLGFGVRRTINKQQKLNLRMDAGYGNGQFNFYINIGEAF